MKYKKCIHCNKKNYIQKNFFIGLLRKKEEIIKRMHLSHGNM
jgi:hypothetical protein